MQSGTDFVFIMKLGVFWVQVFFTSDQTLVRMDVV